MISKLIHRRRHTMLADARRRIERILEQQPFDADAGLERLRARMFEIRVPAEPGMAQGEEPVARRGTRPFRSLLTRKVHFAVALFLAALSALAFVAEELTTAVSPAAVDGARAHRPVPISTRPAYSLSSTGVPANRGTMPSTHAMPTAPISAAATPTASTPPAAVSAPGPLIVAPGLDDGGGSHTQSECTATFKPTGEASAGYTVVSISVSVSAAGYPNTDLRLGIPGASAVAHTNYLGRSTTNFAARVRSTLVFTVTVADSSGRFVTSCPAHATITR